MCYITLTPSLSANCWQICRLDLPFFVLFISRLGESSGWMFGMTKTLADRVTRDRFRRDPPSAEVWDACSRLLCLGSVAVRLADRRWIFVRFRWFSCANCASSPLSVRIFGWIPWASYRLEPECIRHTRFFVFFSLSHSRVIDFISVNWIFLLVYPKANRESEF